MWMLSTLSKVNRFFAYVSGYVLLGLTFLIVFEIFARRFFGFSVQGVDELGGYAVATTGTFSFAYGLATKAHTRIDIVLAQVPARARAVLNTITYVTAAAIAIFMATYAWRALSESLLFNSRSATPLETPIWIPQSIWFAGLVVFAVSAVMLAVHAVILAVRDQRMANLVYGPSTTAEVVERELGNAAQRTTADRETSRSAP